VKRHIVIPDAQIRQGSNTVHVEWAAQAILEYRPDTIVVIGDWFDLSALSTHDAPGSKQSEGRRVKPDIDAGNEAFARFWKPIGERMNRLVSGHRKRWEPDCHFLMGNHEDRLSRAIAREPKWDGLLTLDCLQTPGFKRHEFLKIVELDGIKYCHYFPNPYSGKAIGGTIVSRLNNIGSSFTQGHQQGFLYASKQYPDHVKHGLVCGRFYLENEHYRPQDVQMSEWNGIVVKNGVGDFGPGTYDLMPLSMPYLREKFS
jgi:hypothetical protein